MNIDAKESCLCNHCTLLSHNFCLQLVFLLISAVFLFRHMMANKFSNMSLLRMIEGLAKDGYASNKFLPEGWRVRYITKCFKN